MDTPLKPDDYATSLTNAELLRVLASLRNAVAVMNAIGADASDTNEVVTLLTEKWQKHGTPADGISVLVKRIPPSPTEAIEKGLDTLFEQKAALVAHETRLETGIVQCDDDWPGVFIRGDSALGYALGIENALHLIDQETQDNNAIMLCDIHSLQSLLYQSNVDSGVPRQSITRVLPDASR